MIFEIYHNRRCRKSRETLQLLKDENVEIQIIDYLNEARTSKEIKAVLAKLNVDVQEIIRKEEKIFKDKFKGKNFNSDEWIQILIENPKLIQRPIVVRGNKAVIGRPPENVKNLF